jgi:hypothetical protein
MIKRDQLPYGSVKFKNPNKINTLNLKLLINFFLNKKEPDWTQGQVADARYFTIKASIL